jgi:hypothetical protein
MKSTPGHILSIRKPAQKFKEQLNCRIKIVLRLVRICCDQVVLKQRLSELKEMLISRHNNKNVVNSAIKKAITLNRTETLNKVENKSK